jgi:hypothetical protein
MSNQPTVSVVRRLEQQCRGREEKIEKLLATLRQAREVLEITRVNWTNPHSGISSIGELAEEIYKNRIMKDTLAKIDKILEDT